jgi:hypothetical protein
MITMADLLGGNWHWSDIAHAWEALNRIGRVGVRLAERGARAKLLLDWISSSDSED